LLELGKHSENELEAANAGLARLFEGGVLLRVAIASLHVSAYGSERWREGNRGRRTPFAGISRIRFQGCLSIGLNCHPERSEGSLDKRRDSSLRSE
jgi:hypothetical protein